MEEFKPAMAKKGLHRAIQAATTGKSLPQRGDPTLPSLYVEGGRAAVLDPDQTTVRLHHPANLVQREARIVDGAERPGEHDSVDTSCSKGNGAFDRLGEELDIEWQAGGSQSRH